MKKVFKILTATMLAMAFFNVVGCKKSAQYDHYAHAEMYKTGGASFTVDQVREVEIDWLGGNVEIGQNASGEIHVQEETELTDEEARMRYYLEGTTLKIQYCASGRRVRETEKNLHLSLPKGIALDIDCTSARVNALNSLEFSEFSFECTSGNLEAERIHCDREMEVETTSGSVEIWELTADEFSAKTSSGNISVEKLSARELEGDGKSGRLSFGFQTAIAGEIESNGGDIKIKLMDGVGASILFDSAMGKCKAKDPHTKSKKTYTFAAAEGKGSCNLKVKTFRGDLTVE